MERIDDQMYEIKLEEESYLIDVVYDTTSEELQHSMKCDKIKFEEYEELDIEVFGIGLGHIITEEQEYCRNSIYDIKQVNTKLLLGTNPNNKTMLVTTIQEDNKSCRCSCSKCDFKPAEKSNLTQCINANEGIDFLQSTIVKKLHAKEVICYDHLNKSECLDLESKEVSGLEDPESSTNMIGKLWKKSCPIEGCRSIVTGLSRHLRDVHGLSKDESKPHLLRSRRNRKFLSKAIIKNGRKPRQCPRCFISYVRLDLHMLKVHGVDRSSEEYKSLVRVKKNE